MGMMRMREIRVGIRKIRVRIQGIGVGMRRIVVGTQGTRVRMRGKNGNRIVIKR